MMEFAVQTMTGYSTTLALARWAEDAGLAGLAVADHYLRTPEDPSALDQLTVLSAVAAQTKSLQLSTLVSPITFRHPAVLLKTAQTLDEISAGRFTLGVGAGWMATEHERFGLAFPPLGERFEHLTEALGYLRAAISEDESGYSGRLYRLAPGTAPEPTSVGLRLAVGGGGPKRTPHLAGTYADEFNLQASKVPFGVRIERARTAAIAAGRDPGTLSFSTAFPLVVGADRSETNDRIEEVARLRSIDPDDIRNRWPQLGIPVGDVDQLKVRLQALENEGIGRIYFQVAFDALERIQRSIGLLLA